MRILIAEDDELVRKLILSFLLEKGYEVQVASDGMELIKLALENKPDVIFTDLYMPNMSGNTMIAMIEMYPDLASIPVIIISGATEREIKDMAISKDIPIIPKPIDFIKVEKELEKIRRKLGK